MGKEKITFREWVVCLLILFSVGSLFLVSLPMEKRSLNEFSGDKKREEKIKIIVSGAVLRPGEYEMRIGSSLKSVMDEAGFASFADKKALYSKKILLNSCEISIPEKTISKKREKNRFDLDVR